MTRRAIAYVLAIGAVDRLKWWRWSLSVRRCCRCGRLVGFGVWPWSGKLIVETHTFCRPCVGVLMKDPAIEAYAEGPR